MDFKVKNLNFSESFKPVVIAEMSGNHNGSIKIAKKIIKKAAESGVDMIKFQTYTPETMTLKSNKAKFTIKDRKSLWKNNNLFELYKKAHTPWKWHKELFDFSEKNNLIPFSTPFDKTSLQLLESLGCKIYKVASFEITDLKLLENIAKTGKPIIISTGMATLEEINDAVRTIRRYGCKKYILLKCTSNYPASPKDSNLNTIVDLKKKFKCNIGLSDHTLGIGVAVSSIAYGATVIEKHFVLDRSKGGVDSSFSLEPEEMKNLCIEVNNAWQAKGKIFYGVTKSEKKSLRFRRSLYFTRDLSKGEKISENDIKSLRPAIGLKPKFLKEIINKKTSKKIKSGTPVNWHLIKI